jgi:hypothetical protein
MGTPNSMTILYKTSLLTESWSLLIANVLPHCTPIFPLYNRIYILSKIIASGFQTVLTMVYKSRKQWFWTESILRYFKGHEITQGFGIWIYFRWLRFALSKGPNRVVVSHPLTWGQKQIQFPKCCVMLRSSEYRTTDKVQWPSNPKRLTTLPLQTTQRNKNSLRFSPWANYTDRETAACRRS